MCSFSLPALSGPWETPQKRFLLEVEVNQGELSIDLNVGIAGKKGKQYSSGEEQPPYPILGYFSPGLLHPLCLNFVTSR